MTFDQKLAEEGKMRVQIAETVGTPSGFATVYREKIVKMDNKVAKPLISKKKARKAPVVIKAPKAGTKQSRVNELVKAAIEGVSTPISKDFKQKLVAEIVEKIGMTQAGATTYLYNALKTI